MFVPMHWWGRSRATARSIGIAANSISLANGEIRAFILLNKQ